MKLHYIQTIDFTSTIDRQQFFTLLQFLVYAQNLDYEIDSLGSTYYRRVVFQVQDFLEYTKQSNNYYQLKKLLKFFEELQKNSLIQFFSDIKYRSLVTIPEVRFDKGKQNSWIAQVWRAEELFYHAHPFILPDLLKPKLKKYEFEVQFKVIQVFSSVNIEKIFSIKDFLQNYPSTLNNQQKTKIKKYFIQLVGCLKEHDLIESNYKIISGGKPYHTDQLTPKNIFEGFIIYEKLSI